MIAQQVALLLVIRQKIGCARLSQSCLATVQAMHVVFTTVVAVLMMMVVSKCLHDAGCHLRWWLHSSSHWCESVQGCCVW